MKKSPVLSYKIPLNGISVRYFSNETPCQSAAGALALQFYLWHACSVRREGGGAG
jgi:hypothetical protein